MRQVSKEEKKEIAQQKKQMAQAEKRRKELMEQCRKQFWRISCSDEEATGFEYKAFITRRCFNLNDYFCVQSRRRSGLIDRTPLTDQQRGEFISQNALFTYAHRIAEQYAESEGRFPRILVVDEVLFHGREVFGFLRQFEAAVLDELSRLNGVSGELLKKAPDAFLEAVTISFFWRFQDGDLVEPEYAPCLNALRPARKESKRDSENSPLRPVQDCREFTQMVTTTLTQSGFMDNTSYIPFFRLSRQQYNRLTDYLTRLPDGKAWHKTTWTYCCLENTEIWQPDPFQYGTAIRFLWTLRAHPDTQKGPDGAPQSMRLLILPLFSEVPRNVMLRLKERIAVVLRQEPDEAGLQHLISIMDSYCERDKPVQVQLILFLLSIIEFFRLVESPGIDYDPNATDWFPYDQSAHDLDKIARNFGRGGDMWGGVRYLCGTEVASRELREKLWQVLCEYQGELIPFWDGGGKSGCVCENDLYLRKAEDFFCKVTEQDATKLNNEIQAGGYYRRDSAKTDLYTFVGGYFGYFLNFFLRGDRYNAMSLEYCTAALLMMMDAGVVSLVPRLDPLQRDDFTGCDVQNMLRSGIMAQISKPRRYARFLPALIRLEEYSLDNGFYPWELAVRFGASLDRKSGGNHEMLFRSFVYQVYAQRQKLRDWDFDMLPCLDVPDRANHIRTVEDWSLKERSEVEWEQIEACANHDAYILWERRNQAAYVKEAEEFLLSLNR